MTEKEFMNSIQDSKTALELAKQHGAKFDPETIELPKLKPMQRSTTHDYGFMILTESDICPSLEEAREIIRRCELITRLREYISTWFLTPKPNAHVQTLIDMIDGKIK